MSDRWGASLPTAQRTAAAGVGAAISSLRSLAAILASLGEHVGADEARALATELEPLAARIRALESTAALLQPVLAEREVAENNRKDEARVAREKAETLQRLAKM